MDSKRSLEYNIEILTNALPGLHKENYDDMAKYAGAPNIEQADMSWRMVRAVAHLAHIARHSTNEDLRRSAAHTIEAFVDAQFQLDGIGKCNGCRIAHGSQKQHEEEGTGCISRKRRRCGSLSDDDDIRASTQQDNDIDDDDEEEEDEPAPLRRCLAVGEKEFETLLTPKAVRLSNGDTRRVVVNIWIYLVG